MSAVPLSEVIEAIDGKQSPAEPFRVPRNPMDPSFGDVYVKDPCYREATIGERIEKAKNDLILRIEKHGIAPPDGWVLVTVSDLKYLSNRLDRAGFIFKSEVPDSRNHRGCTYISDAIKMADAMLAAAPNQESV